MDIGMPVPASCFEHADTGAGIFAEAVGEHAARGARANDHIIERFHINRFIFCLSMISSENRILIFPDHPLLTAGLSLS